MDPDKTLEDIREVCRLSYREAYDAQEALTLFRALDEYLSSGGALPRAWAEGGRESVPPTLAANLQVRNGASYHFRKARELVKGIK